VKPTVDVPVGAVTISDATSEALAGIKPRPFREIILRHKVAHARIGKRVVVRVEVWRGFVERLEQQGQGDAGDAPVNDLAPETTEERLSKRLGRERGPR
jgi:hypothetical protein